LRRKNNQLVKIQTGIVKYLNTKPLLFGIEQSPVFSKMELIPGYPAEIARMLENGSIDLGLVPVAAIPHIKKGSIISDYCIGCNGPVASVCIFSDVPIEAVKQVLMDYQSRTSVQLAKILLRNYWKSDATFTDANPDFRDLIKGTTAGLVIGDRAFEQRKKSPFIYDLGEAWKAFTGLPFVFAAWVSNKELDKIFVQQFNSANRWGIQHIDDVVRQYPYELFNLQHYYNHCISYELDEEKKNGLKLFLEMISINAKCKM
jgi:chorismate dehydratase